MAAGVSAAGAGGVAGVSAVGAGVVSAAGGVADFSSVFFSQAVKPTAVQVSTATASTLPNLFTSFLFLLPSFLKAVGIASADIAL